jgi:hypothetical protein
MDKFEGSWELIEKFSITSEGEKIHPWGKDVKGMIIYSKGRMAAQLGIKNRYNFNSFDSKSVSKDEAQSAINSYISYFGTYHIHDDYIIHKIEQSLFPNWVGHNVKRFYSFEGDLLTLEAKEITLINGLEKTVLVWKRLH